MRESTMAAKEKIKLFKRGYGLCHRLAPTHIARRCIGALFSIICSYAGIYLSGVIVDMITTGSRSFDVVLKVVILYVVVKTFLSSVLANFIVLINAHQSENGFNAKSKMMLSEKCADLDYVYVENPDTHRKKWEAENFLCGGASRLSGIGVLLYTTQKVFKPAVAILIGFGLCFKSLFLTPACAIGFMGFVQSVWALPFLFGVYAAVCIVRHKFSVKSGKIFADYFADKKVIQLGREYRFYADYLTYRYQRGKDVRIFNQKKMVLGEFERINKLNFEYGKGIMAKTRFSDIFASGMSMIFNFATYAFVIARSISGMYSPAEAIVLIMTITQVLEAAMELLDCKAVFWDIVPQSLKQIFDFLDIPDKKYKGTIPTEKRDDNEYEFEFHNVSFKYPNSEQYVLQNINLKWRIGEKMALVGRNGSGKSTLVKLLCRLYDPTEGEITLNGIDIRKYDYEEYMALFSVVFQDSKLFSFSIAENVAADTEYDSALVEDCVRRAGLGERLDTMPNGIETCLYKDFDEQGVEISGGEAQKLCLARAIYKASPFIVLDEPTAALDPISEHDIYTKFNSVVGSRTAIYISHRLSSCRFCDDITVLENGRIVENGSHKTLLEKGGVYFAMWKAQAEYYKDEAGELFC